MKQIVEFKPGEWWESDDSRNWRRINPEELAETDGDLMDLKTAFDMIAKYMSATTHPLKNSNRVDSFSTRAGSTVVGATPKPKPISEADITRLEMALEKVPTVIVEEG